MVSPCVFASIMISQSESSHLYNFWPSYKSSAFILHSTSSLVLCSCVDLSRRGYLALYKNIPFDNSLSVLKHSNRLRLCSSIYTWSKLTHMSLQPTGHPRDNGHLVIIWLRIYDLSGSTFVHVIICQIHSVKYQANLRSHKEFCWRSLVLKYR